MIQRLSPGPGRLDEDSQVLLYLLLTDVFVPDLWSEGRLPLLILLQGATAHNAIGHGLSLGVLGAQPYRARGAARRRSRLDRLDQGLGLFLEFQNHPLRRLAPRARDGAESHQIRPSDGSSELLRRDPGEDVDG